MTGEILLQDLVVTKKLRQGIDKYKSLFPRVSAVIQLAREGKPVKIGEVFTNAGQTNPLFRAVPKALVEKDVDYDKEKYRELLLDAAETVLRYFGFDRTVYGDSPKPKIRKW